MNGMPRHDGRPLDLALRPLRRAPDLRRTAPTTTSRASRSSSGCPTPRCRAASRRRSRRSSRRRASSTATSWRAPTARRWSSRRSRTGSSSGSIESVPGVADDSGLGGETMQYQVLLDPAKLAGAGLSVPAIVARARRQQRQRRRRLLLAGRPVLLRARPRAASQTPEDIGNVVLAVHNGTPVLVKDVGQRRDRACAAPRPVRLQRTGRRRRRRHPDAHGRAGPGRPEAGRGEDAGAQRVDPAEGREDPSVLRPERSDRADDAHRRGQPAARHAPRRRRPRSSSSTTSAPA